MQINAYWMLYLPVTMLLPYTISILPHPSFAKLSSFLLLWYFNAYMQTPQFAFCAFFFAFWYSVTCGFVFDLR